MLSNQSLIRRYTPPTCTLEIWAKRSPLSRWAERDLLKEVRFELRFDDPKLPDDEQVTIRGDRTQLELLCDTVSRYVQQLLQPSFNQQREQGTGNREQGIFPTSELSLIPSLKPKDLLNHELSFGSLISEASAPVMKLSVSQLFDLANALDEYNAEATILPTLNRPTNQKTKTIWASTAAAAILAVGLTTVGVKMFIPSQRQTEAITSLQDSAAQLNQITSPDVFPPVPPAPNGTPLPSPTLPPSLAARGTLPTPPAVSASNKPTLISPVPIRIAPQASNLPPAPVNAPSDSSTLTVVPTTQESQPPIRTSTATSGYTSETALVPQFPNLPSLPSRSANSETAAENRSIQDYSPGNSLPSSSQVTTAKVGEANNLLDTIPQVAETRNYFQQRWKTPAGLNQTLEYRLVLNQDGSIGRIIPLGQTAKIYLDRTSMPLMGEPFVSPVDIPENPTIRLVLNPDGTVKTFLEQF